MLGNLPPGYNKAVHGPYDPAVFYGKQDIPLSQVKVYQLPAWLARRQFYNPIAYGRALSRYELLIILRLPLLMLHLKGLLALEPQVLSPQELWAHSFYPDVCWVLCPLLHHELRRHL